MTVKDEFNQHHDEIRARMPKKEKMKFDGGRKRLDTNKPRFQEAMEQLTELYQINNPDGFDSDPRYICQKIQIEVGHLTHERGFDSHCANQVYDYYTGKARSKNNALIIKYIQVLFAERSLELTPTLLDIVEEVALREWSESTFDKPNFVEKKALKNEAYKIILNLIYAGDSLEDAASKAAYHISHNLCDGHEPYKASSLMRGYEEYFRKRKKDKFGNELPSQEDVYFGGWDKFQDQSDKDYWAKARETMPLASPELTGVRWR